MSSEEAWWRLETDDCAAALVGGAHVSSVEARLAAASAPCRGGGGDGGIG